MCPSARVLVLCMYDSFRRGRACSEPRRRAALPVAEAVVAVLLGLRASQAPVGLQNLAPRLRPRLDFALLLPDEREHPHNRQSCRSQHVSIPTSVSIPTTVSHAAVNT
jgi:hypothetical protein